jgi:8-oxo-dGTP pyrophosphatase MutT (NUDIX family)
VRTHKDWEAFFPPHPPLSLLSLFTFPDTSLLFLMATIRQNRYGDITVCFFQECTDKSTRDEPRDPQSGLLSSADLQLLKAAHSHQPIYLVGIDSILDPRIPRLTEKEEEGKEESCDFAILEHFPTFTLWGSRKARSVFPGTANGKMQGASVFLFVRGVQQTYFVCVQAKSRDFLTAPAGLSSRGEDDLRTTAVRETYEETGIQIDPSHLRPWSSWTFWCSYANLSFPLLTQSYTVQVPWPSTWPKEGDSKCLEKGWVCLDGSKVPDSKEVKCLYVGSTSMLFTISSRFLNDETQQLVEVDPKWPKMESHYVDGYQLAARAWLRPKWNYLTHYQPPSWRGLDCSHLLSTNQQEKQNKK